MHFVFKNSFQVWYIVMIELGYYTCYEIKIMRIIDVFFQILRTRTIINLNQNSQKVFFWGNALYYKVLINYKIN